MSKTRMYSVDIVIPTYKRADLIQRCLSSLAKIQMPNEIENIWVVENGPKCGVDEITRDFSPVLPVRYLYRDVGNLSLARNLGIENSNADFIIFFDNDLRFEQETIQSYIDGFNKHGKGYFYGGSLDPDYEDPPPEWLVSHLPPSAKGFDLGNLEKIITRSAFLGGNHAFSKEHLDIHNGYDVNGAEGFNSGAVGEETRLQKKLLTQGIKGVYLPKAKVLHYVPKENCSVSWLLKRAERYGLALALEEKPKVTKNMLFKVPYFHWVRLFKLCLKVLLSFMLFSSKSEKFALNYKLRFQIGVFKGFRGV